MVKCAAPWAVLLYMIITTADVNAANAIEFNTPCVIAPNLFCSAVCVGCNINSALVININAVELSNYPYPSARSQQSPLSEPLHPELSNSVLDHHDS